MLLFSISEGEPQQSSTPDSTKDWKSSKPTPNPKSPIPPSLDVDDSDSELEPDTLVPKYLELQTKLYGLDPDLFDKPKKGKKSGSGNAPNDSGDPQAAKLQRKIFGIETDVLFDRQDAMLQWREKLDELRKEAAFFRQNQREEKKPAEEQEKEEEPKPETEPEPGNDDLLGDNENADVLGDMFGGEEPALETGVILDELNKATMHVRDFGKSTGLSPRRVLEETCKSRDSGCKITFKDISGPPHQNRKAIEVRWSKAQEVPFELSLDMVTHKSSNYATFVSMDKIATPTPQQAEGYVSTLAMFILFPQSSKEAKAYMRLPAAWRDLWTELASVRKTQEDSVDKKTVIWLKQLVQENQGSFEDDVVLSDNFRRRNEASGKPETPTKMPRENLSSDEQVKQAWMDKSSTPSFHYMLQGRQNLPIWSFKEQILSTLDTHRALIICSETGSGKSTQIPSFILEHEMQQGRPCKIYVTEPRRISAISLARRVSEELGESKNDVGTFRSLIGFAVRLESKVNQATKLVFA